MTIHCHIIFPVNYRKAIFDTEVITIIMETAEAITERYAREMQAMGTDKNRIHLLCTAHPKIAPGRMVQIFKGITARELYFKKTHREEGALG